MNTQKPLIYFVTFLLIISLVFAQEDYAELFMIRNGEDWNVETTSDGLVLHAYKPRPEEMGETLSGEQAIEIAKGFLEDNSDCLGLHNFVYKYDRFGQDEYSSYWIVDFEGDLLYGIIPPHTYLRTYMTGDGQMYALGDLDFYSHENVDLIQENIIQEDEAIDSAQEAIESGSEPSDVGLVTNVEIGDTDYPYVWKIKFPDEEVLVDAETGEVISIEPVKKPLIDLSKPLSGSIIIITLSMVIIGIVIIVLFFIKSKRESREE